MISRFYCDIEGTYEGGEDRQIALMEFVSLLNQLDNSEEMIFSFVSSDSIDEIKEYMRELEPYLANTKIRFGNQYSGNLVITNKGIMPCKIGKSIQIYNDLSVGNCDRVYYADDIHSNRISTDLVIRSKYPNIKCKIFCPKNGIESLLVDMNNYIHPKMEDRMSM